MEGSTPKAWPRVAIAIGIAAVVAVAVFVDPSDRLDDAQERLAFGVLTYGLCADCHSLEPGVHQTGPSLAGIWGRPAGRAPSFRRYSNALKDSGLVWNEATLDAFLLDGKALVPGNRMVFAGLEDARPRAALIAFFKRLAKVAPGSALAKKAVQLGKRSRDLRRVGPASLVRAITLCADTYDVTLQSGEVRQFWEYNLRIKTDGSAKGPSKGAPVLVSSGQVGDRAFVIFAGPGEIGSFIRRECP